MSVFRSEKARGLLQNPSFLQDWEKLASQMTMVTVIQRPPFVLTWYEQYADVFEPVLVVGRTQNQRLVGLLPLAYSSKNRELAHAGAWQAEYHGWISEKTFECHFLIQALIAVKGEFGAAVRRWTWRWMPPGANTTWLNAPELKRNGIFVSTIEQEPPVLVLSDEVKIRKIRRNRSLKAKMNRYKRRGAIRLERIVSPSQAEEIFDRLSLQTDFRQMAIHGEKPFAQDPHKREFYLARLRHPENNHFTVLWLDDRPLAYHFGACDETTVYLGLTGYDPTESKNSPGILLFLQLIDLLKSEGFQLLDLTPGEDTYKARLGNTRRKVVEPTFYFRRRDKWLADMLKIGRGAAKGVLHFLKIDHRRVRQKGALWLDFLHRVQTSSPLLAATEMFRVFFRSKTELYFELDANRWKNVVPSNGEKIRFQHYSDLLLFEDVNPWLTQRDVLSAALRHFSKGEKLATYVENERLICFGWEKSLSSAAQEETPSRKISEKAVVFYDFFCHKSGQNSFPLVKMIAEMTRQRLAQGTQKVGIFLPESVKQAKNDLQELGFVPVKKIRERVVLGRFSHREKPITGKV